MATQPETLQASMGRSLHALGVVCGLSAGVWFGAASASLKLVTLGLSPFIVSMVMVTGVFVARWTVPTLMKGTSYIFLDLREKPHLMVWAVLAGALWAVANTLTVFAIRDAGLAFAFPFWNLNSLVGGFWGWYFFRELRGAGASGWLKVLGGTVAIVAGAALLGYSAGDTSPAASARVTSGVVAALGAAMLWGTMYIPFRKAYLSGMNPVSFITVFTVGEIITVTWMALAFRGGVTPVIEEIVVARPALFWLFLGGFCWVLGDLFQQYAAKYIGLGRGVPLSNTNQLWGLAWGILVYGEMAGLGATAKIIVISGSMLMIFGAISISMSTAAARERASWGEAMQRECDRYGLDFAELEASQAGDDPLAKKAKPRSPWDILIVIVAVGVFVALATQAERPAIHMDLRWVAVLVAPTFVVLGAGGWWLWRRTNFS